MQFFELYKKAFTNYVSVDGRAARDEYWSFILGNFVLAVILIGMAFTLHSVAFVNIERVWSLVILLPHIGVSIRRLHDTNRSAWNLLWLLLPVLGLFVYFYFMIKESDKVTNNYGAPTEDIAQTEYAL